MRSAVAIALLVAVAGVASAATTPSGKRRPAPVVAGVTLDGKRVSLAAMRGRPVFVNVWSSW